MFSSGANEYLTETIYDCHLHGPDCYGCVYEKQFVMTHYLSNPANPILQAHRKYHDAAEASGLDPVQAHMEEIAEMGSTGAIYEDDQGHIFTHEEMTHGYKVLQRLARLREESS